MASRCDRAIGPRGATVYRPRSRWISADMTLRPRNGGCSKAPQPHASSSGIPELPSSGVPELRSSEFRSSPLSGVAQFPDSAVPQFGNCAAPAFRSSGVAQLPDSVAGWFGNPGAAWFRGCGVAWIRRSRGPSAAPRGPRQRAPVIAEEGACCSRMEIRSRVVSEQFGLRATSPETLPFG